MSVFYDRRAELERYEFMMGVVRGRLAVTLDILTDALILVGQHGVYCTSARNPTVPALDLQAVLANINGAKELVSSVMERLRDLRTKGPPNARLLAVTVTYSSVVSHLTCNSVVFPLVCSKEIDIVSCGSGSVLCSMGCGPGPGPRDRRYPTAQSVC